MIDEIEEWKPIPGFNRYEVSNLGRVKSLKRKEPIILKPELNKKKDGYLQVNLHQDRKPHQRRIHYLVLLAFVGPRPDGYWALHKDDNKLNNRLDNLRYGTPSENVEDATRNNNGIHPVRKFTVKRGGFIRVKSEDFIRIYCSSTSSYEVSLKTGMKYKTVWEIAARMRRNGIDLPYFKNTPKRFKDKKANILIDT